jgi:hypothetical protein
MAGTGKWRFEFICEVNPNQNMRGSFDTEEDARTRFKSTAEDNPDLKGTLFDDMGFKVEYAHPVLPEEDTPGMGA